MSWLVGVVCPEGHRVTRMTKGANVGRIFCRSCRRTFADGRLVPVDGKVRGASLGSYASGYRAGYERGCSDTITTLGPQLEAAEAEAKARLALLEGAAAGRSTKTAGSAPNPARGQDD